MTYPNFAKQVIIIHTKVKDAEELKKMVKPIIDFANKHEIEFGLNFTETMDVCSICAAEGKTSAYCKGMVAEVKQMLKEIFKCKLDVLLSAY